MHLSVIPILTNSNIFKVVKGLLVHLRKCIYWGIGYPLKKEQRILSKEIKRKMSEVLPVDIEIL